MEFLKINGAFGEGGGQIVRSAVTLSCITKTPIRIENIRAGRKIPGLSAQHLFAIKILARICNAKVSGLKIRSTELEFVPSDTTSLEINENVGTAGSISLILQVLIYAVSLSRKNLKLSIKGGTDVLWSPTINYTKFVLSNALSRFGINYFVNVKKRGYYPKGGGIIDVTVSPAKKINPVSFTKTSMNNVRLFCSYSKLDKNRIHNEIKKIEDKLENNEYSVDSQIIEETALDSGSSILLCKEDKDSIIGADSLWNLNSKCFGGSVSKKFFENNLGVDENLADMLVIPASQSNEISIFQIRKITKHLQTNLYITSKITGCKYGIGKIDEGYELRIKGNL